MVSKIKTQLYELITGLNYKVVDKRNPNEAFPWLLIRTGSYTRTDTRDLRNDIIDIYIDIFSAYSGEKETLEIIDNISNHIQELQINNDAIIYIEQKMCKILDDTSTGVVRKHGVISYRFTCAAGLVDKEDA